MIEKSIWLLFFVEPGNGCALGAAGLWFTAEGLTRPPVGSDWMHRALGHQSTALCLILYWIIVCRIWIFSKIQINISKENLTKNERKKCLFWILLEIILNIHGTRKGELNYDRSFHWL